LIVVDASVLLEVPLLSDLGVAVGPRLFDPAEDLHAPELLDLEVAQVLRRYERGGAITAERSAETLQDLADLRLERYSHRLLIARAWELRANLTVYDAAYVALAELLGCPLLTCDAALARAPHDAQVELLGPFSFRHSAGDTLDSASFTDRFPDASLPAGRRPSTGEQTLTRQEGRRWGGDSRRHRTIRAARPGPS